VKDALDALVERYNATFQYKILSDNVQQLRKNWWKVIHNGHVIVASEAYYRQRIYPGHVTIWNLRTRAFMDSILRWTEYISCTATTSNEHKEKQAPMRCIVWAHNSHIGDMRSTGYTSLGQVSLGQLCRETFGDDNVFLIGMTTYEGSVRAAEADSTGACWQGRGENMELRKAMDDSHESVLHSIAKDTNSNDEEKAFGLYLKEHQESFNCSRLERFVGSCYLPQTEMKSHYTQCIMASQFDYVLHVDNSSAVVV
jgi:erythromycin esterase-like protein